MSANPQNGAGPGTPSATLRQKIGLAIWLTLLTIALCIAAAWGVLRLEHVLGRESRVPWNPPGDVTLRPGPTAFYFDKERRELVYVGIIDDKRKSEIISLAPSGEDGISAIKSYWEAVNHLAFLTNRSACGLSLWLLFLGGIAGSLGVQLRSFTNYVGHTCFKNDLDVNRWWPYYAVRPATGFLLGSVVVIVTESGLLAVGQAAPSKVFWWVSLALLAGFGEEEFTQRLRQLTLTLFGQEKSRKETAKERE